MHVHTKCAEYTTETKLISKLNFIVIDLVEHTVSILI